jgi:hemerythrin-like domain-containing protein
MPGGLVSVLAALTREHALFHRMIDRLERASAWEETAARAEIRQSLLILLPALDKHEEIEDLVFSDPIYVTREGADLIGAELKREQGRVNLIRGEIRRTIEVANAPRERLAAVVSDLVRILREHFRIEEKRLWPHYARSMSRSRDKSASRRVDREVRRLEKEIELNRLAVSDYLEGRR